MCRIEWNPVNGADGYETWFCENDYCNSPYIETKDIQDCYFETGASITVHVEFKVRAYKLVDGKKIYSNWTETKMFDLNFE